MKANIFIVLLLSLFFEAAGNITISGTGYSQPLQDHPRTKVKIYRKPSMQWLKSVYTDTNGDYTALLHITDVPKLQVSDYGLRVIPNPSHNSITLHCSSPVNSKGIITVAEADGRVLITDYIMLNKGDNQIILTGMGKSGTKLITLSFPGKISTCKAILALATQDESPHIQVTSVSPALKNSDADSLYIVFEPQDTVYKGMDTTILTETAEVNYLLQQIPDIFDFSMVPFTVNGDSVSQLTITIQWTDSTINNYVVNNDGYITVHKELYRYSDTALLILDTTFLYPGNGKFFAWTIGRTFQQPTNVANLFQNPQTPPPGFMQYDAPPPAHINLRILPDTFALYLIPKKVWCSSNTNDYCENDSIRVDALVAIATIYGPWSLYLLHYIHVPQVTDSVDIIQKAWHEQGWICDTVFLDTAMAMLKRFMKVYSLPNGDQLFPPHRIYRIYSTDDPRYQAVAARMGDNSFTTQFGGNHGGPSFECDYTYNGYCRQAHGNSCYWLGTGGIVFYATMIHEFGHGLCGFECTTDIRCDTPECYEPALIFKTLMRIKAMLDLGSYY